MTGRAPRTRPRRFAGCFARSPSTSSTSEPAPASSAAPWPPWATASPPSTTIPRCSRASRRRAPGSARSRAARRRSRSPDGAADALVAAQAFHWFDTEQALAEIARVLRPGGIFGPIWNLRDESAEWVARLTEIIPGGAGRSASVHARPGRDFGPLFPQVECAQFRHTTLQTTESLVEMIKSRSGYLIADAAERERVEREVRRLAAGLPQPFELPYLTIAFRARRVIA